MLIELLSSNNDIHQCIYLGLEEENQPKVVLYKWKNNNTLFLDFLQKKTFCTLMYSATLS